MNFWRFSIRYFLSSNKNFWVNNIFSGHQLSDLASLEDFSYQAITLWRIQCCLLETDFVLPILQYDVVVYFYEVPRNEFSAERNKARDNWQLRTFAHHYCSYSAKHKQETKQFIKIFLKFFSNIKRAARESLKLSKFISLLCNSPQTLLWDWININKLFSSHEKTQQSQSVFRRSWTWQVVVAGPVVKDPNCSHSTQLRHLSWVFALGDRSFSRRLID